MTDPHPENDSQAEPQDPAACQEARRLLSHFVTTSLPATQDRHFRDHILVCDECRTIYRQTVAAAARSKREREDARLTDAARRERQDRRRLTIRKTNRAGQGWRLKTALVPAGLILLLCGFPFLGSKHLEARWEAGGVEAAGVTLDADRNEVELGVGDGCVTHGTARVTIEGHGGRYVLEGDTRVYVVDPGVPWVRVQSGGLELEGSGRVGAQLGLVELEDGLVRLRKRGHKLEIDCISGTATVLNAGLKHRIGPGERAVVGLGEILVERSPAFDSPGS